MTDQTPPVVTKKASRLKTAFSIAARLFVAAGISYPIWGIFLKKADTTPPEQALLRQIENEGALSILPSLRELTLPVAPVETKAHIDTCMRSLDLAKFSEETLPKDILVSQRDTYFKDAICAQAIFIDRKKNTLICHTILTGADYAPDGKNTSKTEITATYAIDNKGENLGTSTYSIITAGKDSQNNDMSVFVQRKGNSSPDNDKIVITGAGRQISTTMQLMSKGNKLSKENTDAINNWFKFAQDGLCPNFPTNELQRLLDKRFTL